MTMAPVPGNTEWRERLLARIRSERERAERSAAVAARHEALAAVGPGPRVLHWRMAAVHRQIERRHLVTALLYRSAIGRLEGRAGAGAGPATAGRAGPTAEAGVALTESAAWLGESTGAVVALVSSRRAETLCLASDDTARRAHELEYQVGEGPGLDAMRAGRLVAVAGPEIHRRWRVYGPGVAELSVRSVASVPLALGGACLGALTLLNPRPGAAAPDGPGAGGPGAGVIGQMGEVLGHALLGLYAGEESALVGAALRPAVHQAAGMFAARYDCSVDDALALIRARAFAEDRAMEEVATDILRGRAGRSRGTGR